MTNPVYLAIRRRAGPLIPALPALEAAHVLRAPSLQEQGTLCRDPAIVVIACMECLDPEEVVCQLERHTTPSRTSQSTMQCQRNTLAWDPSRAWSRSTPYLRYYFLHSNTVVPPLPGQAFFSACGPSAGALMRHRFWQHEALDYVTGVDEGCNGGLKEREDGCGRMRGGRGQWGG